VSFHDKKYYHSKERNVMSIPPDATNPSGEHPSTYFVQDRSNRKESIRLQVQDQMLTASMGGVLAEQPDPTVFHRVLDVGCGTGSWLIEAAKTYPTIPSLIGIDISSKMVEFARGQASAQLVGDRVEFRTMDVLRQLDFPDDYFGLVNLRLGTSYLRTWDWPEIVQEFQRVTWLDGVTRLTECDTRIESNSPGHNRLNQLFVEALSRAGHLFNEQSDGVVHELVPLLKSYGFHNVQTRAHVLNYRAGTVEGQRYAEDLQLLFSTLVPFLQKWTRFPDNYDAIYQQALDEIRQPGFVATWNLFTIWGSTR
jgi:ubiquinone/menaquinone biosynthesis C-methylase UbiE